jgi:hypothetical protein
VAGGNGDGIRVIDLEQGWNFNHEDLRQRTRPQRIGKPADRDHGTATLGVISADLGAQLSGVLGVAFACSVEGASAWTANGRFNPEDALLAASADLPPGSVVLVELQWGNNLTALETGDLFRRVTSAVTDRGIHVVAAAGNGGRSLDTFGIHQPELDSGSILVGAGGSHYGGHPLERVARSNWGARVNVQGWGQDVVTCGGNRDGMPAWYDFVPDADSSRCYTKSFSLTSSASAIVAGAVACVSGAARTANRVVTPAVMRDVLRRTGQPQVGPTGGQIGPLPDLRAALASLGLV